MPGAAPPAGPVLDPRDRVVAPNGSDAAAGTAAAPWQTLQHAADSLEPGGTAWIRGGTYAGFRMTRSGDAFTPLTFAAWPGDPAPVVDGALDLRSDVILLRAVHDVRIRGLTVTGAAGGDFKGSGIRVENGSARVELSANLVTANDAAGIVVADSTQVLVADNELSHDAAGVRLIDAGEGSVVRGNAIHHMDRMLRDTPAPNDDAGGDGVSLEHTTGTVMVTGNRLWANRARSTDYGWDGGAFSIYGASHVRIEGNEVWDNENVLETGTDPGVPCADNRFVRNIATGRATEGRAAGLYLRCAEGMLVAHNTLRELDFGFAVGPDSVTYSGSVAGLQVVNNIVDLKANGGTLFGFFLPLPSDVVIDHDLLRTSGTVARWGDEVITDLPALVTRSGFEADGAWGDPRFRGPDDATLQAGSPAIDAALPIPGLNDAALGAGPDQGALERDPLSRG